MGHLMPHTSFYSEIILTQRFAVIVACAACKYVVKHILCLTNIL